MRRTTDRDVRSALMTKVIAEHVANPDTLVIEELGLDRGACRVDVAVVNGHLHGYEIKSDSDTLARLPSQVMLYGKVLDKATLVVGAKHLKHAEPLIPPWWGIRVVSIGARNALSFQLERPAGLNPSINPVSVAQLLWRDEIVSLLADCEVDQKALRGSRTELSKLAGEILPLRDLRLYVRESLKRRTTWRCREQLSQRDG